MTEWKIIVDESEVEYEGLFSLTDLYKLIDKYAKEKGYDKEEKENTEQVTANGKDIHLILQPNRKVSDYFENIMKIEISARRIKDVETEMDKKKIRLNEGYINIKFSAILKSDYEGRWKDKPMYYFIRTLFDKYIYRSEKNEFEARLTDDLMHLKDQVGAFLNLHRHRKTS